jgi:hypothetical protein
MTTKKAKNLADPGTNHVYVGNKNLSRGTNKDYVGNKKLVQETNHVYN